MIKPVSLKTAKKIFESIFPKNNTIVSRIKLNKGGHTNISYCVTCGDVKYQMKFARPSAIKNLPSKLYFSKIMKYNKYIYHDVEMGITIRKWIDGETLSNWGVRSIKNLERIFFELKKIHLLPKKHFKFFTPLNLYKYRIFLSTLNKKYKSKYIELVEKYKNEKLCISKIDNASNNILLSPSGKLYHIDNEWVQLANDYWDYAETLRWILDFNWKKIDFTKYIKNFSMSKLNDFIFMSCVYNYLWSFKMDPDPTNAFYRKFLLKSIKKSFKNLD